jgi:hypothetical protein
MRRTPENRAPMAFQFPDSNLTRHSTFVKVLSKTES